MTKQEHYKQVEKQRLFLQTFKHLAWRRSDRLVSRDDLYIALLNTGELSADEFAELFIKMEYYGTIYEVRDGYYKRTLEED